MAFPFRENSVRLRQLRDQLHKACEQARGSEAHQTAIDEFNAQYEYLAFPGGLQNGLDALKDANTSIIPDCIAFLEADPWFFRSGYAKAEILRRLKNLPLTDVQRKRLLKIILQAVDYEIRSGFSDYARLAGVIHTPDFIEQIMTRTKYTDEIVSERARRVMHNIKSYPAQ